MNIAIVGLGNIGSYFYNFLKKNKQSLFNKTNVENSNKNIKEDNICKIIEECDIDKIAEILIKKGREKDYPDITSN